MQEGGFISVTDPPSPPPPPPKDVRILIWSFNCLSAPYGECLIILAFFSGFLLKCSQDLTLSDSMTKFELHK